jgi:hypothetical protein
MFQNLQTEWKLFGLAALITGIILAGAVLAFVTFMNMNEPALVGSDPTTPTLLPGAFPVSTPTSSVEKVQCVDDGECDNFECPISNDPYCFIYPHCTAEKLSILFDGRKVVGECTCITICQ